MKLGFRQRCKEFVRILLSPTLWFDVYWPASRKYWFSLLLIGVICAKLLHIYSHLNSLSPGQFLLWGPTFFLQDVACILIAHALSQNFHRRWHRVVSAPVVILASLMISGLAAANISFYTQTGAEIHWRQAHAFHRDAASVKTLLAGLTGIVIMEVLFSAGAWISTPYLYNWVRTVTRVLNAAVAPVFACWKRKPSSDPENYAQVAHKDWDEENSESEAMLGLEDPMAASQLSSSRPRPSLLLRILVASIAAIVLLLRCIRPSDTAYSFLSQTVILTPFEKPPQHETTYSVDIPPDLPGDYSWLYNHTALAAPPTFDWLPREQIAGFRDWYEEGKEGTALHYDPAHDPLKISNLDRDVLEPWRDALKSGNVNIKHVFLLKLESTRYDVFPVRKDSHVGDIIRESYGGNVPDIVDQRLANLSRNAERLTGVSAGWDHSDDSWQPRGGMYASNAYTGDTFTLKSILASVCGIAPLVVDFNREYLHHIYEPCMPHILNALNTMSREADTKKTKADDFKTWPWHSTFMQSITDNYDNQDLLLPALGFKDKITDERITKDWKKKPGHKPEKFNFWGYPEHELRPYLIDTLKHAEKHHERLFLTHLTGQTHYPWDMPKGDKIEEFMHHNIFNGRNRMNRYLNTLGVADRWLGEVLEVIEEAGVANETLVVMVGDHGISLIEDGGVTPYDNPGVSNFHVPLVFSHPQLPQITIDGRVTSMQIVPTIMDLLVESGSLDKDAAHAIKDLLPLYEGQSMIRELVPEKDGKLDWQFTVMNTGATWLALRSGPKPYRLVIPLVPDVEWRFSDVDKDPLELHTVQSFTLHPLLDEVAKVYGEDAMNWVIEAAHVTRWWVSENWRRYEYKPEA
ncbi:sulfatase domain protein [Penicillium brasilianum]|uniref:Sulfatase domain protein n=1 Tax=Penicillium brasilianum TaxID=104259 RepID=A0A1S9RTA9_PENBI|nr:sulfatase domain protein [Penicillium brasilianum]